MKVLLFDDSAAIRKVVELGLGSSRGDELDVCPDPKEVGSRLAKTTPDLIIASETVAGRIPLPLMSEASRWKSRAILLADSSAGEKKLRKMGFERVLRKPFRLPEFRKLVDDFRSSNLELAMSGEAAPSDQASRRFVDEVFAGQANHPVNRPTEAGSKGSPLASKSAPKVSPRDPMSTPGSRPATKASLVRKSGELTPAGEHPLPEMTMDVHHLESVWRESLEEPVSATQKKGSEQHELLERVRKLRLKPSQVWGAEEENESEAKESPALPQAAPREPELAKLPAFETERPPLDEVIERSPWAAREPEATRPRELEEEVSSLAPVSQKSIVTPKQGPDLSMVRTEVNRSLQEFKRSELDGLLEDRLALLSRRLRSDLKLEIDKNLLDSAEALVKPHVETFLNAQWPILLKSVTLHVKKAVETEYTSRMHGDLVSMQKNLAQELRAELRAELRNEVQSALRNWMGNYSRDILKEVAREELQKLLDDS